jgi:hypothetical protein
VLSPSVSAADSTSEVGRTDYAGWLAAGLVILAVGFVAAAFWFKYHP